VTGVPRWLLERAIELAKKAQAEPSSTGTPRPKVGAIICMDGVILSEASRNEDEEGGHAEQIAFRKTQKADTAGATVITTLEPCMKGRSNHTPHCAELIALRGVQRVVIGALDPNPDIIGKAEFVLRRNGIVVERFPDDLARVVYEVDAEHVDYYMKEHLKPIYVFRSH
jgi:diaminohydroxyphosphoribosylaminopyrimidine deaminase/5-amino-6-(5-phosphoribosylamino)uracil reductase